MYKKAFSLLLSLTAFAVANAASDRFDDTKAVLEEIKEKAYVRVDNAKAVASLRVSQAKATLKEAREESQAAVDEQQIFPVRDHDKAALEEIKGKASLRVDQAKVALKETREKASVLVDQVKAVLKEAREEASDRVDEATAILGGIMQDYQAAVEAQQIFPVVDSDKNPCLCTCRGGLLIDVITFEGLTPTKTLCLAAVPAQFFLVDRPKVFKCTPFPACPVKNELIIKDVPTDPATAAAPYEDETVAALPQQADENAAAAAPQDETMAAPQEAAADPQQRK